MKNPISPYSLIFSLLLLVNDCFASVKKDSSTFSLDMKGQITAGKKKLSKAMVLVYEDGNPVLSNKIESDADGWVAFQLPIQKSYTLKVTKYGYITKIITVDTKIPKSQQNGDYYFEFAMELFEEIEGLDVSILKDPVAKIFFNTFTKKFDYDYNYTIKVNDDLKKLYKNYELLKKQREKATKKSNSGNKFD